MINNVDSTFNVLVQLILADEASESLLEFVEMNGCRTNPMDPFGSTTDSSAFVAARKFLGCSYDDLFRSRAESLSLLLRRIRDKEGKGASISRITGQSAGELICIELTLEDNSLLSLQLGYLSNTYHLDCCTAKVVKKGIPYFLEPFTQSDSLDDAQPAAYAFAKAVTVGKLHAEEAPKQPAEESGKAAEPQLEKATETQPKKEAAPKNTQAKKAGPSKRIVTMKPTDFFVRLQTANYNHHGHSVEPVYAKVETRSGLGKSEMVTVTAYYCKNCKKYYISSSAYDYLKRYGYICCRVYKQKDIGKNGKVIGSGKKGRHLQSESLVHSYGYNVGQKANLSAKQRQTILRFIVEKKIMNPLEITGFIEYLIGRSEAQSGKDMSRAISRWKADVKFLEKVMPAKRSVQVKTINVKR